MAKLELYTVTIGGIEHTMQLSPPDVERYGDAAVKAPAESAARASNRSKSSTAADKAAEAAANKAVTAENK